jgi:hypothetical protein
MGSGDGTFIYHYMNRIALHTSKDLLCIFLGSNRNLIVFGNIKCRLRSTPKRGVSSHLIVLTGSNFPHFIQRKAVNCVAIGIRGNAPALVPFDNILRILVKQRLTISCLVGQDFLPLENRLEPWHCPCHDLHYLRDSVVCRSAFAV